MAMVGWIGVDLDGTLAEYGHWQGADHIGAPIAPMVERVQAWRAAGREVRIFTARISDRLPATRLAIEAWCQVHLGEVLPVTNEKDFGMVELWDDRCVQVVPNTGQPIADLDLEAMLRQLLRDRA